MRHSRSTHRNPRIVDWSSSYAGKGNLAFFGDALAELRKRKVGHQGLMAIGLLGQRDIPGVTLRSAQSLLRWDQRPSLWSHSFLFDESVGPKRADLGNAPLLEITLHPRTGTFPRPENNGVVEGRLGLYDDPKVDANAALLVVEMDKTDVQKVRARAKSFNIDRIRYNLWETLGIWQGFLWSQGDRPNPLRQGVPIFSASYVEMAFEAIRLDLTPGASERNSAPEHLWNAAVWWHDAFAQQKHPMSGFYVLRDKGCSMMSTDE